MCFVLQELSLLVPGITLGLNTNKQTNKQLKRVDYLRNR